MDQLISQHRIMNFVFPITSDSMCFLVLVLVVGEKSVANNNYEKLAQLISQIETRQVYKCDLETSFSCHNLSSEFVLGNSTHVC